MEGSMEGPKFKPQDVIVQEGPNKGNVADVEIARAAAEAEDKFGEDEGQQELVTRTQVRAQEAGKIEPEIYFAGKDVHNNVNEKIAERREEAGEDKVEPFSNRLSTDRYKK